MVYPGDKVEFIIINFYQFIIHAHILLQQAIF
jgi:hypothetical protein